MSSNELGEHFRILTFGESHGPAMGVVIDGVVPGMSLSIEDIQVELDRRRPGTSPFVSSRQELDRAEILSGVFNGVTTGAPICIVVRNHDARPADYDALADIVRPGHGVGWLHRYGVPRLAWWGPDVRAGNCWSSGCRCCGQGVFGLQGCCSSSASSTGRQH